MTNQELKEYAETLIAISEGAKWEYLNYATEEWCKPESDDSAIEFGTIRIAPNTTSFNGQELPAPMTEAPEQNKWYHYADPHSSACCRTLPWDNDVRDRRLLARGLIFSTAEEAAAWGRAMCPIQPKEEA